MGSTPQTVSSFCRGRTVPRPSPSPRFSGLFPCAGVSREGPPSPGPTRRDALPVAGTVLAALLILGLAPVPRAEAGSLALTRGFGARAIAMGGAFTGLADDYAAIYYNPAGIAQITGYPGHLEYLFVCPRVYVQEAGGAKEHFVDKWTKSPMVGLTVDLSETLEFTKRRVVVGWGGVFPDNFKNVYKVRWGSYYDPYFPLYGDSTVDQSMGLWAVGAVEVFPWLMLGGGIFLQIHGQEILMNVAVDTNLQPVIAKSTSKLEITSEVYPVAGLLLKPTERLRVGFAWRKSVEFVAAGGNQMYLKVVLGPDVIVDVPQALVIPARGHFRPEQYAVGASYRLTDRLLLAADATYYDWRPNRDEANRPLNPPMKNIVVPRVGAEYFVREEVGLRMGYSYQESPVRQQKVGQPVTLLDNDVHTVSLGVGVFWDVFGLFRAPPQWSLFYELQILEPRTFPSVHPGDPPMESSGMFHGFGFGIQFQL